ncbi:MAG TPA: hypothetical protein DCR93_21305 [Cytophagales bacterium]|nr:hypothetical protein [Cytophagales bacterium]
MTLGRGYDLGNFSQKFVEAGLEKAGIDPGPWRGAFGLKGQEAANWLKVNKPGLPEITRAQQRELFIMTYAGLKADVVRISNKADVLQVYGATNFDTLDRRILDIVVDLRYRGDYSGATRKRVQPCMVRNDVAGMAEVIRDREFWRNVPEDRFRRRVDFIESGSAPQAMPVQAAARQPRKHVVEPGESLDKLSARFQVSIDAIVNANRDKLKTWGSVQGFNAGEEIQIP